MKLTVGGGGGGGNLCQARERTNFFVKVEEAHTRYLMEPAKKRNHPQLHLQLYEPLDWLVNHCPSQPLGIYQVTAFNQ